MKLLFQDENLEFQEKFKRGRNGSDKFFQIKKSNSKITFDCYKNSVKNDCNSEVFAHREPNVELIHSKTCLYSDIPLKTFLSKIKLPSS